MPQSTFSHIVAVSQKNPKNPVGHVQLIVESGRIKHVPPFWQILAKLDGQGNVGVLVVIEVVVVVVVVVILCVNCCEISHKFPLK